jgi:HEAT repeat protein
MRPLIAFATITVLMSMTVAEGGGPKKEDVPKLINTLKTSSNAKARSQAAADLGQLGGVRASWVENAMEPLLEGLKNDKDSGVRAACAKALGDIGTNAEANVDALTESLKDSSVAVKIAAAAALGQFGPDAKGALPSLRDLAKMKDDKKLSKAANAAIQAINGTKKK